MRLLNNYEVNAGKYLDRSFTCGSNAVSSILESKVEKFSSMVRVIV